MARRNNIYHGSNLSFIDMLFNIIILFALIFFAAILLMNEPTKKKDVEAKADIIITMSWPDLSPHDIDLWISTPDGAPIGYIHKENSYLFLERDDLGISNNFIIENGEKVPLAPRREVASFRGTMPGRYVVNTVFFAAKAENGSSIDISSYAGEPVKVIVEIIQINPTYRVLGKKEILLTKIKEERTAFAFIMRDNDVTELIDDLEEPFVLSSLPLEGK